MASFGRRTQHSERRQWGRVLTRQTLPDKADPKRQLTATRIPKADRLDTAPKASIGKHFPACPHG